ncbi:flagellar biosynthesis repressor FlbT [Acetobacter sacchari]|uniref:Flagellar biosynthesis repressor FlbT n=1 Tax=Acetobacter sacchari TaxID=2661687 RepID=A0ABS3LTY9_9PROT|nr:flagellar biosynthesis repressor FlbT [Acetobacter sacchari]
MAGLGIRLDANDRMIINGAGIHFLTSAQIRLTNQARFLFGRQLLPPEQANTPARRIYYALQTAYVGTPEERTSAFSEARYYIEIFSKETTSETARELLSSALASAEQEDLYTALKLARRIIRHEDAVLGATKKDLGV